MAGRPRKPTKLKMLQGTLESGRTNFKEPETDGCPEPPDWLDGEALDHWRDLVPKLERMRILDASDAGALTLMCTTWAKVVEIAKEGGFHPAVWAEYRRCCGMFGASPSDRSKVNAKAKDGKTTKDDYFKKTGTA